MMGNVGVTWLGQAGFRLQFNNCVIFIDPYLSNSVEEMEGAHLHRLTPIFIAPEEVIDADWTLITHIHLDHCDPKTLGPLSLASPKCLFLGPGEVIRYLEKSLCIDKRKLHIATEKWHSLSDGVRVFPIPAAHKCVETDCDGHLKYVGYIIEYRDRLFYHSGDCSVNATVINALKKLGPIDVAFLPVNECNYYRDQQGIIGNMSVREAFGFGEEIGAEIVVPMHYDMFAVNCTYREEIEIVYKMMKPRFKLQFNPKAV